MNKTLGGIRVLDLTHMLSGPFAAMMLADLGAETIKVEPLQGEGTRRWCEHDPEYSIEGMGVYFLTLNRNKQSVALDLKSGPGLGVFHDLVRKSDVVISNFGPGVAERLKIDYPALSAINPRIVTCCITGYGADGPDFQRASFDLVAQATGGMMSVTGLGPEQPLRTGPPIADIGGGLYAAMGVLAALLERQRSGQGQHVDISMLDCQLSLLNYLVSMTGFTGRDPQPAAGRGANAVFEAVLLEPAGAGATGDGHGAADGLAGERRENDRRQVAAATPSPVATTGIAGLCGSEGKAEGFGPLGGLLLVFFALQQCLRRHEHDALFGVLVGRAGAGQEAVADIEAD